MPRNIVICCDGTGNQIKDQLSNVLKLYRVLQKTDEQLVYYSPGVGTVRERAVERLGQALEEPIAVDGYSVPDQRKILLENEVRVQLKSSEIIVSFGHGTDNQVHIPATLDAKQLRWPRGRVSG